MKLNAKGKELWDIWYKNYCKENDKLGGNSAKQDFVEGWSIIDNKDYIKNITDECGLLIFAYDEHVFEVLNEWADYYGKDDIGLFGYAFDDVRNELLKYFEVN